LKFRQIGKKKAFFSGGSNYQAPAAKDDRFFAGKSRPALLGGQVFLPRKAAALQKVLPEFVTDSLKRGH